MEIKEQLISLGWHISDAALALFTENGTITNKNIAKALDVDIKEFGEATLATLQKQSRIDKIVLQIQKIRNVASPKSKEESQFAPRMLKLTLTDGHTTCQAVEICNISFLSRASTPPGAKLLVKGAKIISNCILLNPSCCELLGGRVPALYEKWEIVKNISHNIRSAGSDGAPPWVNFGEKIIVHTSNEPFKALADKNTKETADEFDLQRQDAISSATTGAVKKVFGGGVKQSLQFNNNKSVNYQEFNKPRYTKGYRNKGDTNEKSDKPQKPQDKVSLFDFLEDKLPVQQLEEKPMSTKYQERESTKSGYNKFQEKESTKYNYKNQPQNFKNFQTEHNMKPNKHKTPNVRSDTNSYIGNQSSVKDPVPVNSFVTTSVYNKMGNQNHEAQIDKLSKNMTKLSFDSQFAAKTLKQHLNLGSNKKTSDTSNNIAASYNWKVGDYCMAKYWEDGKYYNAVVTNLTQNTCVVNFNGYGNVEEVLKVDCIPLDVDEQTSKGPDHSHKNFSRGMQEYRNNKRPYINKSFNGNLYYKS